MVTNDEHSLSRHPHPTTKATKTKTSPKHFQKNNRAENVMYCIDTWINSSKHILNTTKKK
jgi:hypothetical protein